MSSEYRNISKHISPDSWQYTQSHTSIWRRQYEDTWILLGTVKVCTQCCGCGEERKRTILEESLSLNRSTLPRLSGLKINEHTVGRYITQE